jgi:hypothetical protein
MTEFNIRSDNVDVEQIMRQIRSRIREKRGVDYTEEEIRELANVKLEKFLDPRGVRSDLLQQFRHARAAMPAPPNFAFEDSTLFESHRGIVRFVRKLLNPILKLLFNPGPLIQALHIQSQLNTRNAQREELDTLHYEVMHNLVVEITRLGIEVKNLTMRLESMSSRLDFDERRARALEGVVQYRAGTVAPLQPPTASTAGGAEPHQGGPDSAERRSRRRRRRGRKRPGYAQSGPQATGSAPEQDTRSVDAFEEETPPGHHRERSGASGDARAERSEPGGVQGPPPTDRERSGASGDARAERSEPGGVQGPPPTDR